MGLLWINNKHKDMMKKIVAVFRDFQAISLSKKFHKSSCGFHVQNFNIQSCDKKHERIKNCMT